MGVRCFAKRSTCGRRRFSIAIIAGLLYLDGTLFQTGAEGLWLLPLLLFFALGTAWDMASLLAGSGRLISSRMTFVATAIVTFPPVVPLLWPLFGSRLSRELSGGPARLDRDRQHYGRLLRF